MLDMEGSMNDPSMLNWAKRRHLWGQNFMHWSDLDMPCCHQSFPSREAFFFFSFQTQLLIRFTRHTGDSLRQHNIVWQRCLGCAIFNPGNHSQWRRLLHREFFYLQYKTRYRILLAETVGKKWSECGNGQNKTKIHVSNAGCKARSTCF